jgi:acyl-CoA reductase-like NAD-dependent aldehyde dehydrogenase
MQMLLAGEWIDGVDAREVSNPWTGEVIDTVPSATAEQV